MIFRVIFFFALLCSWCAGIGRPPVSKRKFVSPIVDGVIQNISSLMMDHDLALMFENCLPNTLDTTVAFFKLGNSPSEDDSFVITGDISAMWLRDSMNQVLPYFRFAKQEPQLQALLRGLVNRHVQCILTDPWANAHNFDSSGNPGPHQDDSTSSPSFLGTRVDAMSPAVFERKYELDSQCSFLKLSRTYYDATNDSSPFGSQWLVRKHI
jgi:meiotically up-regulated gene 157 (Mug157) protein